VIGTAGVPPIRTTLPVVKEPVRRVSLKPDFSVTAALTDPKLPTSAVPARNQQPKRCETMHSKTDNPLVLATIGIWLALEVALVLREARVGFHLFGLPRWIPFSEPLRTTSTTVGHVDEPQS
jgi:hypothetical protein